MSSDDRAAVRGIVEGKVQGVWFRAFTREQALKFGLSGYARNQPDGSVAFALCGQRKNIEQALKLRKKGRFQHLNFTKT